DGLAVLERLDELNLKKRPRVIVLTALARDDIAQRLTEMGADYYMLQPVDMELSAHRLRQFATGQAPEAGVGPRPAAPAPAPKPADLEAIIPEVLHEMGMRAHFKGYQYLREGVLMTVTAPDPAGSSLSKDIDPRLADKYNATPGGVEAAIRN